MSRDLSMATPFIQWFAAELIKQAEEKLGLTVIVSSVDRSFQHQVALYAQGRQPLDEVNFLRKGVGLPSITDKENSKCVTWTMNSRHIINLFDTDPNNDKSRALDLSIIIEGKYLDRDKDVDADGIPEYTELYLLAKTIGGDKIRYGAEFSKPDMSHYEER